MSSNRTKHSQKMQAHYDALYSKAENFWGIDPSPLSLIMLQQCKSGRILDIGCGQGPDALFFAKKGFDVTAIDISSVGLNHLKEQAEKLGISKNIKILEQDMQKIEALPKEGFDILFSRMSLQMIPEAERENYIKQLKEKYPKALHIHIIPIDGKYSARFGNDFICKQELLQESYSDWEILFSKNEWTISRSRNNSGEPYLMHESWLIARKK